jgi:hypothetical protein
MMRISPTRAYTWVASLGLFLQGTVTLAALLVPAVDGAMPVILGETQMVASHSLLHIVSALIGFAVLRVGGPPGTRRFALGFGLFYVGLGIAGAFTGQPLLLSLKPFDHPFHIVLGGLGLLAVTAEIAMPRAASRNNK